MRQRHSFPPTSIGGSWRACGRRAFLGLVAIAAFLSLVYLIVVARNSADVVSSSSSTLSSSRSKFRWCPYYPGSVDEISSMFDSKSLLDLHITVDAKLSRDTHVSLLVASESVLPMLVNWMCVTRKSMGSLPKNLLVVVPPGNSSAIMQLDSKGIAVVQMKFRWVHVTIQSTWLTTACIYGSK